MKPAAWADFVGIEVGLQSAGESEQGPSLIQLPFAYPSCQSLEPQNSQCRMVSMIQLAGATGPVSRFLLSDPVEAGPYPNNLSDVNRRIQDVAS